MEKPRKRRKKKSKFWYYLYAIVILLLTVTNITLAILLLTHVQHVAVSGTAISTEDEIRDWATTDPKTVNSLYTLFKYKRGDYELPVYLDDVQVSLSKPWEVQVQVTEKKIVAGIAHKDTYIYLEEDGLVMEVTKEPKADVPLIEGVSVQGAKQFEVLKVKEEKLFSYIADISHEVKKNELKPDHIVWENDSMNLYFGEVCVELGKMNYDVKLAELPPVLGKLEGKAGVIHMQHYSETSESITFEAYEDLVPTESTDEVEDEENLTEEPITEE